LFLGADVLLNQFLDTAHGSHFCHFGKFRHKGGFGDEAVCGSEAGVFSEDFKLGHEVFILFWGDKGVQLAALLETVWLDSELVFGVAV
jgi:hypothetical protein